MYPYPDNIGININNILDSPTVSNKKILNTIITIYGLPSTGKGTVSKLVAEHLNLPVFDTGILYRVFTFFLKFKELDFSEEIIPNFLTASELHLVNNQIQVHLFGKLIVNSDIRNPEIDSEMGNYTKIKSVRAMMDKIIHSFVLKSSFVTDGRGAFDGYLVEAEKEGVKVIRVLLQAEQHERIRRRFIDYLGLERGKDLNVKDVENLWIKCSEIVKYRDAEEILKDQTLNLGMISDDSGILDTTNLSVDQVVSSVLGWVNERL